MKNYILFIAMFFASMICAAQQVTYKEFQEEAKTEINLRPEYGNLKKSTDYDSADKTFINNALQEDGTPRKASEHLVQLGFKYLYQSDLKTAMRRFNQAWLLDPTNENSFWGFGAVYFMFDDKEEALKQLKKGLSINPKNSKLLTDEATINMAYYQVNQDKHYLLTAIELFNQSYQIDSQNQNTLFKLSAAYFYNKDCINAWKFYDECMKLGGKPIPPGYKDALQNQCTK